MTTNRSKARELFLDVLLIMFGSAVYAVAFDLFLAPNEINGGGVSGAAMVFCKLTGLGTVGVVSIVINVPLFLAGWRRLGRKFFLGSLLGMLVSSVLIDVLAAVPAPKTEPLLGALYGGVLSGLGIGLVFTRGASTGGVDIAARLLKQRLRNMSMGHLMLAVDGVVVVLTGVAFRDVNAVLYCAVTLYVSSITLDGMVYGFEYSKVALIITEKYEAIATAIDSQLDRGVTLLKGQGYYKRQDKMVLLSAVKRKQLAELKALVMDIDPDAFIILQDAHQVLGDGFKRYDRNEL